MLANKSLKFDEPIRKSAMSLEDAAALLAAIVASSSDAILSKTLTGKVTSWNQATVSLFGYTESEMIGESIRRIIPADLQQEEDMILQRIAAGERIDNYETARLHKDGTKIQVSVTISPIRDATGNIVGASTIARDITEKKRSEEQIRALVMEVNHRAKNMLALVQAIARQTVPAGSEAFLEQFFSRIHALSANQDLLVFKQWRGVGLDELIGAQSQPFADMLGSRVMANGPSLHLTSNAAQTFGMALHELLINALKFGSLSNAQGRVSITWRRDGDSFVFDWVESGGPPVVPPTHKGYGTQVISRVLEHGLGAKVELDFAPSGFSWCLSCPAQRVLSYERGQEAAKRK